MPIDSSYSSVLRAAVSKSGGVVIEEVSETAVSSSKNVEQKH